MIVLRRMTPVYLQFFNDHDDSCEIPQKIPRSTRKSADNNEEFGLFCCWCGQTDDDANLTAAGIRFATKDTTVQKHVKEQTEQWKKMALSLKS